MWNRFSGKSNDARNETSEQARQGKGDENPSKQASSSSTESSRYNKSISIDDDHHTKTSKKSSSRGDDRDRRFNPSSSSYSSTTQTAYPGAASVSVATASGNHNDEPYTPAGLVRNDSLGNQMPKSRSSRNERYGDQESDVRSERRRKKDGSGKERDHDREDYKRKEQESQGKYRVKGSRTPGKYENGHSQSDEIESSRGPADFPNQVGATGFSQFPGQHNGDLPHHIGNAVSHQMSSHIQDQFPGQFPDQSTAPYRPPIASSEGGPGLAAEYYGDAGESVAEQPGNRTNTPSLIIGAEPHLQPALAVAAPPPEPSASGAVGAAASFFSGEFDDSEITTNHGQSTSSTYTSTYVRPSGSHHSSSTPAIPTLGGTAMGVAGSSFIGNDTLPHASNLDHAISGGMAANAFIRPTSQRPPSPKVESYYSSSSRPSKSTKQNSQTSNIPLYAAGAAGAADLAASAYHQGNHPPPPSGSYGSQQPTTSMAHRHRHHGPLGAVVDFFKDPDGVAQFEEYSEIIGVCRYCFAPGSSPRDAPRKHHYRKKRSSDRIGRVDKDTRYHSSENEGRHKRKDTSWFTSGLAGYGLAKVGESLFKQKNDFDDTYSLRAGRQSPGRDRHTSKYRKQSKDPIETGITSDGIVYKKSSQHGFSNGPNMTVYETRSRSGSRSQRRKSSVADVEIGAIAGSNASVLNARRHKHSSPSYATSKAKYGNGEHSTERRTQAHKNKKKASGLFSFGRISSSSSSASSSSGSVEEFGRSYGTNRSSAMSKDDRKAQAALLGLGAAAATLASNKNGSGHKRKGIKQTKGLQPTIEKQSLVSEHDYASEDEVWESAPEDEYESAGSGLAYGTPRRQRSRDSLSSQSSGTEKWDWRWGSKRQRDSSLRRKSSIRIASPVEDDRANVGSADAATTSPDRYQGDITSSLPLQQVFPMPTSDPTRFDVGRDGSLASSSRPSVVPIQHPQPIAPISATIYSTQAPHDHSYSAPTGIPILPTMHQHSQLPVKDISFDSPNVGNLGRSGKDVPKPKEAVSDIKSRRRDSSPPRFSADAVSSSMVPRRRSSVKDDASVVRFDRTEEQDEDDRRERRRKRKEEKERQEAKEEHTVVRESKSAKDESKHSSPPSTTKEDSPKTSFVDTWSVAAAGLVGAAVGSAAVVERSKSDESKEERRERRRKDREREKAEEEEFIRKREKRRKEKEKKKEVEPEHMAEREAKTKIQETSSTIPKSRDDTTRQGQIEDVSRKSVWQEIATPKKRASHENYGDFFRPLDLADDQAKITSRNADGDMDFDQAPAIVTVAPRGFRDPDSQPVFSSADTEERVDPSTLSFAVPKLRLVEPTPPSSRGSTPGAHPRDIPDEVVDEPTQSRSTSRVTWGDDQTHEHPVNVSDEEPDEIIEPSLEDNHHHDVTNISTTPPKQTLPVDEKREVNASIDENMESQSLSYGDDLGFAATLAASAEDAGFDPSIVIDDPEYRRRNSPPGSNDRSILDGVNGDDEDGSALSRSERKRRDKSAKRQMRKDVTTGRDDDAVVQDIISQVEGPTSQVRGTSVDDWGNDSRRHQKRKSKKSRKEDSESKDEFFEASESASQNERPEDDNVRQLLSESKHFIASDISEDNKHDSSEASHRTSAPNDTNSVDPVIGSTSSSISSGGSKNNSESKDKSKGSIWDCVLGRSRDDIPKENNDPQSEMTTGEFEQPKKGKRSKGRKSTGIDQSQATGGSSIMDKSLDPQLDDDEGVGIDSGRMTQDLSAKNQELNTKNASLVETDEQDVECHTEGQHPDQQRLDSFLDMRPEPPPPPDISVREDGPPGPSEVSKSPGSPHRPLEDRKRQLSENSTPEPFSSPTAVPFDFRFSRPRPLIGSARSMSQNRIPTQSPTAQSPRPKPRPRSTEFTSSKEFRPLMLVERHRSHQESTPEETYPSLPSSHTTSRSSSVKDHDDGDQMDHEMTQTSVGDGLELDPIRHILEPDILDSQQATPTARSFRHSAMHQSPISPSGGSVKSTNHSSDETILGDATSGAMITTPAVTQDASSTAPSFSSEEQEQFKQALDTMATAGNNAQKHEESFTPTTDTIFHQHDTFHEGSPTGESKIQQDLEQLPSTAEFSQDYGVVDRTLENLDPRADNDTLGKDVPRDNDTNTYEQHASEGNNLGDPYEDAMPKNSSGLRDPTPRRRKSKGKQKKRESDVPELLQNRDPIPIQETPAKNDETSQVVISAEQSQQLQEQDAQDAVDTWFSQAAPKKTGKAKKKKGSAQKMSDVDKPTEELTKLLADDHKSVSTGGNSEAMDLIREQKSDQLTNIMASAGQDSDKAEGSLSQPPATLDRGPVDSQLERRQSKSKGKKGKKGWKSSLQVSEQQATFSTTKESSPDRLFSGQSTEGQRGFYSATTGEFDSKADGIGQGEIMPVSAMGSPSAVALPIDDDLDLGSEFSSIAKGHIQSGGNESESNPSHSEVTSRSLNQKAHKTTEQPSQNPTSIVPKLDQVDDEIVDSPRTIAVNALESQHRSQDPGPVAEPQDASPPSPSGSTPVVHEDVHEPTDHPEQEAQEDTNASHDELAEPNSKGSKQSSGIIAERNGEVDFGKQSPIDEPGAINDQFTSSSVVADDDQLDTLKLDCNDQSDIIAGPTVVSGSQIEPTKIEENVAVPDDKQASNQGNEGTDISRDKIDTSGSAESFSPTTTSQVDRDGETLSTSPQGVISGHTEDLGTADKEGAGFVINRKKRNKKGKGARPKSDQGGMTAETADTEAPLYPSPNLHDNEQPYKAASAFDATIPMDESAPIEDEWTGFSTTKKGKKDKKRKSKVLDKAIRDVAPESLDSTEHGSGTPNLGQAGPSTSESVEPQQSRSPEPVASQPVDHELPRPKLGEQDSASTEPIQPRSVDSDMAEPPSTTQEHFEVDQVDLELVQATKQESSRAAQAKSELYSSDSIPQESGEPDTAEYEPPSLEMEPSHVESEFVEPSEVEHGPHKSDSSESEQVESQLIPSLVGLSEETDIQTPENGDVNTMAKTPQEVATIPELSRPKAGLESASQEASSNVPNSEIRPLEPFNEQNLRDEERDHFHGESSNQLKENFASPIMEVIKSPNDRGSPNIIDLAGEHTADLAIERIPSQELESVKARSNDEILQAKPGSPAAVTNTAKDVHDILRDTDENEVPDDGGKLIRLTYPIPEQRGNEQPNSTKTQEDHARHEESAQYQRSKSLRAISPELVEQTAIDQSPHRSERNEEFFHGKSGNEVNMDIDPSFDEAEVVEFRQGSIPSEPEISAEQSPSIGNSGVLSALEAKEHGEDQEQDPAVVPIDDRAKEAFDSPGPDTLIETGFEEREVRSQDEPAIADTSAALHLDKKDTSPLESGELPKEPEQGEDEPITLQGPQPKKSKKDKRKAKKAKLSLWDEEGEAAPVSNDKAVQEMPALENDSKTKSTAIDKDFVDDPIDFLGKRTKKKKDRKEAKKAQSAAWKSTVATESDHDQQSDERLGEHYRGETTSVEPRNSEKDTIIYEHAELPVINTSEHDSGGLHPTSTLRATISGLSPSEEGATALEEQQPKGKMEELKRPFSGKRKEKKERKKLVDNDIVDHNRSERNVDGSAADEVQDQPSRVPLSDQGSGSLAENPLTERPESIEFVKLDEIPEELALERKATNERPVATTDGFDPASDKAEDNVARFEKDGNREEAQEDHSPTIEPEKDLISNAVPAEDVGSDHASVSKEQRLEKIAAVQGSPIGEMSREDPAGAEDETQDSHQTGEDHKISTADPADELWDLPTKKGRKNKKNRKNRKEQTNLQEDFPTTQQAQSEPSGTFRNVMEPFPGTNSIKDDENIKSQSNNLSLESPENDLLDPIAQRKYDLAYAQELERQGIASPRSSGAVLPVEAPDVQAHETHITGSTDHENDGHGQQQDSERAQTPFSGLFEQAPREDVPDVHRMRDHEQKHSYQQDTQRIESLQSPITNIVAQAAEYDRTMPQEGLDHSPDDTSSHGHMKNETPSSPAKDISTPSADVDMLDAQEQQAYNDEYAKELERQLGSLQGEKPSDESKYEPESCPPSQPSIEPMVGLSLEQRMPLAKSPSLDDIVEESRSRSGSVQPNSPIPDEEYSQLKPPKKSKRGKKDRKPQQPIIWEDDTATPPVTDVTDGTEHVIEAPATLPDTTLSGEDGNPSLPLNLEEAGECHQMAEDQNVSSFSARQVNDLTATDDYFTIRPESVAEKDVGGEPGRDDLGHSSKFDAGEPTLDFSPRESISRVDEVLDVESRDHPSQEKTSSTPAVEASDDAFSFAQPKKSNRGKKSKRRETDSEAGPSSSAFKPSLEQSETLRTESIAENTPSQELSPQPTAHAEDKPSSLEEESQTNGIKTTEITALKAAGGLGAAATALNPLSRRDTKKGSKGKKGKKGKNAKAADPGEEFSSSQTPVVENAQDGQILGQEGTSTGTTIDQTGPSELQNSLGVYEQNPIEESTIGKEPDHTTTPPLSPLHSAMSEPPSKSNLMLEEQIDEATTLRSSTPATFETRSIVEDTATKEQDHHTACPPSSPIFSTGHEAAETEGSITTVQQDQNSIHPSSPTSPVFHEPNPGEQGMAAKKRHDQKLPVASAPATELKLLREQENPAVAATHSVSANSNGISQTNSTEEGIPNGERIHQTRGESSTVASEDHTTTPTVTNTLTGEHDGLATPSPIETSPPSHELDSQYTERGSHQESSNHRDSAINIFDSPVVSDEPSFQRSIRDSGYPETVPSPTVSTDEPLESAAIEKADSFSNDHSGKQGTEVDGGRFHTPDRGRLPLNDEPGEASQNLSSDIHNPDPKPRERQRRSRSHDSDDSNDSGFDIQRRRRRQAVNKDAREPSPVSSTTKDRSSVLFDSSPSAREVDGEAHKEHPIIGHDPIHQEPTWSFSHGDPGPDEEQDASDHPELPRPSESVYDPSTYNKLNGNQEDPPRSLFGGPATYEEDVLSTSRSSPGVSEAGSRGRRLKTISEDSRERLSLHAKDKRAISDVGSPESGVKGRRVRSPPMSIDTENPISSGRGPPNDFRGLSSKSERSRSNNTEQGLNRPGDQVRLPNTLSKSGEGEHRAASAASMRSDNSIHAIIRTPDQIRSASGQSYHSSGTPPLRRVDRSASSDLRGASKLSEAKTRAKSSEADLDLDTHLASSSTYDPVTDKGKSRADMADVYEGWGDVRGQSPMSPTRPPSMRKRQSMQILDLETRLDQLVSENRLLQSQKSNAERSLQDQTRDHSQQRHAYEEALQEHKAYLSQKDSELDELRELVEEWQGKVNQLTEVNQQLTSSRALNDEHEQRYRELEDEHVHLKERHTDLTTGMEALVQREVASHLDAKNSELQQLRIELDSAKQRVRNLQQQLSATRQEDDFLERDEDYFDTQCQSLCQHVQQWVLRFSKFSDMKLCYRASEIRDETKVDRMENAILDGTDVDVYLQDRVKRRDVFMAVVMTMIFDYIFTRYLFGMDREQRQKLKNLEKTLQEIGPLSAVNKWRATTLTLLMKREDFSRQRATDTEAIVHEIYDTLAAFLPPPSHLVQQIQESLRKVINIAGDLSIEMRTQRADYQMLPPLQPDYDLNGDLAHKVYFNALTMNERSGAHTSNQALQEQGAVVRMVLFPLVVKNEEDDEQIIVCPAQVLTASSKGKKTVRVMSVQGSTQGGRSEASFADVNMGVEGGII